MVSHSFLLSIYIIFSVYLYIMFVYIIIYYMIFPFCLSGGSSCAAAIARCHHSEYAFRSNHTKHRDINCIFMQNR